MFFIQWHRKIMGLTENLFFIILTPFPGAVEQSAALCIWNKTTWRQEYKLHNAAGLRANASMFATGRAAIIVYTIASTQQILNMRYIQNTTTGLWTVMGLCGKE